jgi:hypothetical protein
MHVGDNLIQAKKVLRVLTPLLDELGAATLARWPPVRADATADDDVVYSPPLSATEVAEQAERAGSVVDVNELMARATGKAPFSQPEIDLLAMVMALVKLLFVAGHLGKTIVELDAMVWRVVTAHQWIRCTIADDIAEFVMTHRLLRIATHTANDDQWLEERSQLLGETTLAGPAPPISKARRATTRGSVDDEVILLGDLYVFGAAWREMAVGGRRRLLRPMYMPGAAMWRLRPCHALRRAFETTAHTIRDHASIVVMMGSHDVRTGLNDFVRLCRYDTIVDGARAAVAAFFELLTRLIDEHKWRVAVHSIPLIDPDQR